MSEAVSPRQQAKAQSVSQWTIGIEEILGQEKNRKACPLHLPVGQLETCLDTTSFWLIYSFPHGGKLALRTCYDPQQLTAVHLLDEGSSFVRYRLEGAVGEFTIQVECPKPDLPILHYTTSFRPHQDVTLKALPRDVYVLDRHYRPMKTEGIVHIAQNGPTSGTVYFSITKPKTGNVLYFQNLTALNDYCQLTQTDPSSTVGSQWPELGLSLPTSDKSISGGKNIVLSDAYLFLHDYIPADEFETADQYIEAVAQIYRLIPKPVTAYFDWPTQATKTVRALMRSPGCGRRIDNHYYLNAYVGSAYKPPESMVQLAILMPLIQYAEWTGAPVKLVEQLRKNVSTFFDKNLGTIVRWLPGIDFEKLESELSEEENPVLMDSWYLFHSLINLGRLVQTGDEEAKELFMASLDYVIKAAHHFGYEWPVFYNMRTLAIVKEKPKPGTSGEHDVPGLFTYLMIQAFELTKDETYIKEAETSAGRLVGKGFELLYQTNNTIMSAVTLVKLWHITSNRLYFDLSKVCMASVIAKMWLWDCKFGHAQQYTTFMGVSCLQDAAYVAAYEEEEALAVAVEYLKLASDDISPSLNLLLSEYMKYLLHRGRYYLPTELSKEAVCTQPREGYIQPKLPIPLEDLRTGWQQAGQVGQEVYGSASAFVLTSLAYVRLPKTPIIIYSEYPILKADFRNRKHASGEITIALGGTSDFSCRLQVLKPKKKRQLTVQVIELLPDSEHPCTVIDHSDEFHAFHVPGGSRLRVEWTTIPTNKSSKS